MNKKKSMIIAILIIASIIITAYLFLPREPPSGKHEFILEYDYQNSLERQAINVSVNLDYEEILGIPRYNQSVGFPNFIDETVIDDYIEVYENTNEDYDKWFNYSAKGIQIKNSTMGYFVDYNPIKVSVWDEEAEQYVYINKSEPVYDLKVTTGNEIIYEHDRRIYEHRDPIIARYSSGDFVELNNSQNFTIFISEGYIIEMSLKYGYTAGCCDGLSMRNNQVVILDADYNPICIIQFFRGCMLY